MKPKSKRKGGGGEPVVPHVRFIPQESRYCDDGHAMVEIVSCTGCFKAFPAMATNGDTLVPVSEYFNHCFECPQRDGKCIHVFIGSLIN